jgi:hypothetical protein
MRIPSYRVFFPSLEDREPPHISVAQASHDAEFCPNPLTFRIEPVAFMPQTNSHSTGSCSTQYG